MTDRRRFLREAARWLVLAALGAVAGRLTTRRSEQIAGAGACAGTGCSGCVSRRDCGRPGAAQRAEVGDE